MRTLSLLFSLVAVMSAMTSAAQNQSKITQLKKKINVATGIERFDLLNDLAWEHRFDNPDTALLLSQSAYSLGESIQVGTGLARALNISGLASNYSGHKVSAYEYYTKALEVAKKQEDSTEIAYTHNNLGRIFQEQGLMVKAFPNIIMALEIFKKTNDSAGLAYCYQSLGYLYQAQRNYNKAAENYRLALELRIRLSNQRNIQSGYHLLGRLYAEQHEVDKALSYLIKADSVGSANADKVQLAETWVYISKCYLFKGMTARADSLLTVSLNIIRNKKIVRILSNALLIGAEISIAQENMPGAKLLLEEALLNSQRIGDRSAMQDIYYQLWKLNEKRNDRLAALFAQNQYLLIRDTMKNLDVARQEDELDFARKILIRETENQKLKTRNKVIQQQKLSQAILLGSSILFALIAAVMMGMNLRRVKTIGGQLVKKNEMLLQLNNEKDSLMSIVAHDLKSPLNKVQGLSSLLKMDGVLSENQSQYMGLMDKVIRDGLSFISDLLSVHALEEQRKPEISEFDVAEVIQDKIDAAVGVASSKKIKLKPMLLSVIVKSDKEYLGRITDNLISNAIKFSPEQSEISISVQRQRRFFLLVVEDCGPGFTEQDRVSLFKKFTKLSARPTGGESSNGLGLAIVKTLVDRLGGDIDLVCEKGKGAKFIIQIPIATPTT